MRTLLKYMKKRQNEIKIPQEKMLVFENIINTYYVPGRGSNESDSKFMEALYEHLTEEQRILLWEQNGGCRGFGQEKARKEFAVRNADKPLPVKLDLYIVDFENSFNGKTRNIVLNEKDNAITYSFGCDGCYKNEINGRHTAPLKIYYESCAGGRMQNLETALGINLRIERINIPSDGIGIENPCVFTFKIINRI